MKPQGSITGVTPTTSAVEGSPLEQELAHIWSEVLGVPSIGRDDDFFELGGHSLMALDLKMRIREALGVATFPLDLLTTPTVSSMSQAILAKLAGVAGAKEDSRGDMG